MLPRLSAYSTEGWLMNFHFSKLLSYENAHDCYPTSKPSVSAVLFGFHGINLFKNLISRELIRILENFHFSISISKHFGFTFHFSRKSESILISLCTSRKRVKAFFFHFALLEKEWKLFIFTYMVYIAYFTELNLQICNYAQKRPICPENCKYE